MLRPLKRRKIYKMKIKNLADLNALKEKAKSKLNITLEETGRMKIVVGMATCGIAAGATPVMLAISEEIESKKLSGVEVSQVGCIGLCEYEPIVEVFEAGKDKVTYVKMTEKKAKEIIESHIVGGKTAEGYTITGA